MFIYADSEAGDADVQKIVVAGKGFDDSAVPSVVYGTMTAFAAMTDMTPGEQVALSYILLETPLWNQLSDLWPLLVRGDILASLQGQEALAGDIPLGFVAGR